MTLGVTYFANAIEYTIETLGFLFPFLSFSYSQFQNSRARVIFKLTPHWFCRFALVLNFFFILCLLSECLYHSGGCRRHC